MALKYSVFVGAGRRPGAGQMRSPAGATGAAFNVVDYPGRLAPKGRKSASQATDANEFD